MPTTKFKMLLEEHYVWPDYYEFKFIVKIDAKDLLLSFLTGCQITEHLSKNGNYISITARKLIKSTDEVIEIYQHVSTIKGVISL